MCLFYSAIQIFVTEFGENHPEVAECYNSMGILYKDIGKREEAINYIQKGISILSAVWAILKMEFPNL